jgi:hypothetical protein
MSVKALVGATIGFFVGGPTGARIGWTIGSFLDAPEGQDTQGPRLDSLTAEALDYGTPIPIVYGRARLAGFRMWQRAIREQTHTEEVGGKGGGGGATNTTYSYYGTFAVGICEGPIVGIRKIWADSILIYDASDTADLDTIVASNHAASLFTVYPGSSTQDKDSLIEATQGSANTPAYRNLAYIVFDDLPLEKYGNRIPNITCEVVGTGSWAEETDATIESNEVYQPHSSISFPPRPYYVSKDKVCFYVPRWSSNYPSTSTFEKYIYEHGTLTRQSIDVVDPKVPPNATSENPDHYWITKQGPFATNKFDGPSGSFIYQNGVYTGVTDFSSARLLVRSEDGNIVSLASSAKAACSDGEYIYTVDSYGGNVNKYDLALNLVSTTSSPNWGTMVIGSSRCRVCEDYIYILPIVLNDYTKLYRMTNDLSEIILVATLRTNTASYYNTEFNVEWPVVTIAYGESSPSPSIAVIKTYVIHDVLSPGAVTVSEVVTDICERAGLESSYIDVTDLTDEIDGYIISRNMSARSAIEPLQKAYFFDGAEFGNKINFVKRGSSSIKTITQDDLGATDYGSDKYALKQTRMQNSELPSDVSIGYISSVRDYEVATQRAQRINYSVPNSVGQELAIVMSDDNGLQIADITLYNAYTEREKFEFALTNAHVDLNPTDVVTVTYEGDSRVVRLVKLSHGDVIECEAISEDSQGYTSTATAATDSWSGQTIGLAGPTRVEYMDIPILRNADNDAGMYYSACGYYAGWTGAQIFKSLDGGVTYNAVDAIFAVGTVGSATTALADAVSTLWDRDNTVTVSLINGTLSSATEDNVIRGSNYLLLGSEIIQFANATLNADGTYTLDTLLRGRRGTEWATDSHAIGDRVVLLTESLLGRFEAIISTERAYKAVTLGQYVEGATAKNVTNTGVSLKPFSPAYIEGSRDGSNNLTITWMRRSRYIGSPLWNLPLYEDSESYEVDVMSGATVLRTISASSETASYSAAEQTSDGLTPGDPVTINVYQLSATAGRGYGTEATI